jgi:Malectin domain
MGYKTSSNSVADQERAELEAILSSGIFARSPGQAGLLVYICEEYFNGRAARLKEYTLATEVLKRPPTFDPSRDAIVRVEFYRIRKKLKDFYEGGGAHHELKLVVFPGQYVPQFVRNGSAYSPETAVDVGVEPHALGSGEGTVAVPRTAPPRRSLLISQAAAAAIAVGVGLTAVLLARRPGPAVRQPLKPPATASLAPAGAIALPGAVRIVAGYTKGNYIDRAGRSWQSDGYFTGGQSLTEQGVFIARTLDPAIFQTFRTGRFSYDIPLQPGNYEMSLYFDEWRFGPDTLSGGGEASRLFDVYMNGRPLLHLFDITKDAGGDNTADVRVFKRVSPGADGKLHLDFRPVVDSPVLNAIAIVPAPAGKINPIRIVARQSPYIDHEGRLWEPDTYARGGQLAVHLHRTPVTGTPDPELYAGERFGNFNYAIPVPPGKYDVTLHFAETYWGTDNPGRGAALSDDKGSPQGGVGSRIFNVYFNGQTLLRDFDVFKAAGGSNRALDETFHGLEPNAQGKLVFSFVPDRDYACVSAIEVDDESR